MSCYILQRFPRSTKIAGDRLWESTEECCLEWMCCPTYLFIQKELQQQKVESNCNTRYVLLQLSAAAGHQNQKEKRGTQKTIDSLSDDHELANRIDYPKKEEAKTRDIKSIMSASIKESTQPLKLGTQQWSTEWRELWCVSVLQWEHWWKFLANLYSSHRNCCNLVATMRTCEAETARNVKNLQQKMQKETRKASKSSSQSPLLLFTATHGSVFQEIYMYDGSRFAFGNSNKHVRDR